MIGKLIRGSVTMFGRLRGAKKGAAMAEYAILVAGVALVCLVAVTMLGAKVGDMFIAAATVLPGAQADDNHPIVNGKLIETKLDANNNIVIDGAGIVANSGTERLGNNLGIDQLSKLVVDPN
jgi:Flp pilus assembly pilin Flp